MNQPHLAKPFASPDPDLKRFLRPQRISHAAYVVVGEKFDSNGDQLEGLFKEQFQTHPKS